MKSRTKFISLLLLPILIASALVLKGCGNEDDEKSWGCPDGSVLASGSDIIQRVSGDINWVTTVYYADYLGSQFQVGAAPPTFSIPITNTISFAVTDQFASEKNDICIEFNGSGIFWDRTFTSILGYKRYVTKTNAHGTVDIYYSSMPALASAPAPTAGGSTGADARYADSIMAHSGAAQNAVWRLDLTVSGCPDPLVDPTPCP